MQSLTKKKKKEKKKSMYRQVGYAKRTPVSCHQTKDLTTILDKNPTHMRSAETFK